MSEQTEKETPEETTLPTGEPRRFWRMPVQKALQQAWADAKQASQGVEDELRKRARTIFGRDGASGEASAEDAQEVEVAPEAKVAQGLVGELRERLQRRREDYEQKLRASVQGAIERVQQPVVAEITAMRDRVEALSKRLSAMRPGGKAGEVGVETDDAPADAPANES
ncbi:MAG: hypothetical protein CSA65_04845 [Proteobacteria bacterium]|nr:MAG: hypothetical protein CSB49_05125 [Pseudomonadota bacterium]PIE18447.1 MAG: hypothetical protein CSA65_04845 [Pseudomonadota bacterium]